LSRSNRRYASQARKLLSTGRPRRPLAAIGRRAHRHQAIGSRDAHVDQSGHGALIISHLPPRASASDITSIIERRVRRAGSDAFPIADLSDASSGQQTHIAVRLTGSTDPDSVVSKLSDVWGIRTTINVELEAPLPTVLVLVLDGLVAGAQCALAVQEDSAEVDLVGAGLPGDMSLPLAGHVGPVLDMYDPLLRGPTVMGRELTRAARVEPRTPTGEVYVTAAFAGLMALTAGCGVTANTSA
jgi:hypothetical protein